MTIEDKGGLEEQLCILEDLHAQRQSVMSMRRDGARGLVAGTGLGTADDLVEDALVLIAIQKAQRDSLLKSGPALATRVALYQQRLRDGGTLDQTFANDDRFSREPRGDNCPVLRAALAVRALSSTVDRQEAEAFAVYLNRVLFELLSADPLGGIRASERAEPTAMITNACTRAALRVVDVLEETAKLLEVVTAAPRPLGGVEPGWIAQEERRAKSSMCLSISRSYKVLWLTPPEVVGEPDSVTLSQLQTQIAVAVTARNAVLAAGFGLALAQIERSQSDPRWVGDNSCRIRYRNAATARTNASALLRRIMEALQSANIQALRRTADELKRELSTRALAFLRSVIDRELSSAARHPRRECDGAELAFALSGYARLSYLPEEASWSDPRIADGAQIIATLMSEDGYLPGRVAFNVIEKGYRLHAAGVEVMIAVAHVLQHAETDIEPALSARMLRLFHVTRASQSDNVPFVGWTSDQHGHSGNGEAWSTALAVDALGALHRMLDSQLNRRVLRHFSVVRPGELKLSLDDLFYPDYGLAHADASYEPIALKMHEMQAHILGLPPLRSRLFSAILYGPPGTGKTTFLEALATTAGVPLVQVTPSDILTHGSEHVESRARSVFSALSMITGAVILLDEFDSILRRRGPNQSGATIFEYLTPGMLPKLKRLHETAKEQRFVFVLATNFLERLDAAATREGRFDQKIGVFPPDPLARLGRLQEQYVSYREEPAAGDVADRMARAVGSTGAIGMARAGKPGWFTKPKDTQPEDGSLFAFVESGDDMPGFDVETDEVPTASGTEITCARPLDIKEARRWSFVAQWDQQVENCVRIDALRDTMQNVANSWTSWADYTFRQV